MKKIIKTFLTLYTIICLLAIVPTLILAEVYSEPESGFSGLLFMGFIINFVMIALAYLPLEEFKE